MMYLLLVFVTTWIVVWALLALWALATGKPVPPIIDLSSFRDK